MLRGGRRCWRKGGGRRRASRPTLRPIYPKVTGLKKGGKSEIDVSQRMALDVLNERRHQHAPAVQLSGERAVRIGGTKAADWVRRERAESVELGKHTFRLCGEGAVSPETAEASLVRRHQGPNGISSSHDVRRARLQIVAVRETQGAAPPSGLCRDARHPLADFGHSWKPVNVHVSNRADGTLRFCVKLFHTGGKVGNCGFDRSDISRQAAHSGLLAGVEGITIVKGR